MRFELTKEYETGIEEIDREHRQFFDYVNSAIEAIDKPADQGTEEARRLLVKLTKYAATHLQHEEEYMERTDDPCLPVQQQAHAAFRKRVDEFLSKGQLEHKDLGDIFIFMAKWLKDHILSTDKMIGTMKAHADGRFQMTDEYMTGIEMIDDEHAVLFDIIGRVHDTINDEHMTDRFDAITDILRELREYTVKHFTDEENYMRSISYDGLEVQRKVHEAFVDKVSDIDMQELSDQPEEEQNEYLNTLVDFLNDWLVSHIMKLDKKIPKKGA